MSSSPPATGAVLLGDTSDVDGSDGALNNPESHTFGLPIVGGAGSKLRGALGCVRIRLRAIRDGRRFQCHRRPPRRWRLRLLPLQCWRVLDRLEGRWHHQSQGAVDHLRGIVRGHDYNLTIGSLISSHLCRRVQGNNNSRRERPPSPSILSQSVHSSDTDTATHSSWCTNFFLAFATSTVSTTYTSGFKHGADIARDSAAYDR